MDDMIQDAKAKGLIAFTPLNEKLDSFYEYKFYMSLERSQPIITDPLWWETRGLVLAYDLDRTGLDLSMGQRLAGRVN